MAKFVILIFGDPQQWDAMSPEQQKLHDAGHVAFNQAAGTGVVGGEELQRSARTARTRHSGKVAVTDGPFLETKEMLGGLYLVEAASVDEVEEWVNLLPEVHAGHSGVEIRAVVDHG